MKNDEKELRLAKARALLKKHKLDDWEVEFTDLSHIESRNYLFGGTSYGAAGVCHFASKHILVDLSLVNRPTRFRQTVLHEIAHALLKRTGHGIEWLQIARKIGCTKRNLEIYMRLAAKQAEKVSQ